LRLRGEMGSGVLGFQGICEGKERRKEEGYLLPFLYNKLKMGYWAFFWAYL